MRPAARNGEQEPAWVKAAAGGGDAGRVVEQLLVPVVADLYGPDVRVEAAFRRGLLPVASACALAELRELEARPHAPGHAEERELGVGGPAVECGEVGLGLQVPLEPEKRLVDDAVD